MEWRKPGIKLMVWNIRKKKNILSEQQEEKIILKNEDRIRSLWDNFRCTNIQIIRVLEGEEEEQEIKNLFKK